MSLKIDFKIQKKRQDPANEPAYLSHPIFAAEREKRALGRAREPFRRRSVFYQLCGFVVLLLLWNFPIVNPVKLLVVLFHEFSHMVAAYVTGGVVFGMAIDPGGAGVTLGMKGNELAVVMAGYLGSFAVGFLLYALSAVWAAADVWAVLTLLSCLSLVFGWLNSFTALFGYGTIALLIYGLFGLPDGGKKFFLRIIATTCCLYPILDVWGELTQRRSSGFIVKGQPVGSDVAQIANLLDVSAVGLSLGFIIISAISVIFLIDWAAKKDAATEVKGSLINGQKRRGFRYKVYRPNDPSSVPTYRLK